MLLQVRHHVRRHSRPLYMSRPPHTIRMRISRGAAISETIRFFALEKRESANTKPHSEIGRRARTKSNQQPQKSQPKKKQGCFGRSCLADFWDGFSTDEARNRLMTADFDAKPRLTKDFFDSPFVPSLASCFLSQFSLRKNCLIFSYYQSCFSFFLTLSLSKSPSLYLHLSLYVLSAQPDTTCQYISTPYFRGASISCHLFTYRSWVRRFFVYYLWKCDCGSGSAS